MSSGGTPVWQGMQVWSRAAGEVASVMNGWPQRMQVMVMG
jgi:hypothetical protein